MKVSWIYTIVMASVMLASDTFAQQVEKSFALKSNQLVTIDTDYTGLIFKEHDESTIKVEATAFVNLLPIENEFEFVWDATKQKLIISIPFDRNKASFNKQDLKTYLEGINCDSAALDRLEKLLISSGVRDQRNWQFDAQAIVYVPKGLGELVVSSTYGQVELDGVNPDRVTIDNVYGQVLGSLPANVIQAELRSVYGTVDVQLPQSLSTVVSLETHYGDIYSNVDIELSPDQCVDQQFKSKIVGTILSGGSSLIQLKSQYSNVYLRKG